MAQRLGAIAALVLMAASTVLAAVVVSRFPRGLSVLACMVLALAAGWWALLHRGPSRIVGAAVAALLLAGALVLVLVEGRLLRTR